MGIAFVSYQSIPLILLEVSFLTAIGLLAHRILYPTILPYPWPRPTKSTSNSKEKTQTVILAGSYNPPHNGHLAMLSYLAKRYGTVIAVIGMNPNKQYAVSPEERAEMLRKMMAVSGNTTNVRVEVVSYYIWRYAMAQKAQILFRGIRSWAKDGTDELQLLALNTWGPIVYGPLKWPLPTVFLEGDPQYNHISSTLIRDVCAGWKEGDKGISVLDTLVPLEVVQDVTMAYSRTGHSS